MNLSRLLRCWVLVAVAGPALAGPGAAGAPASSIVYLKGGNVHLAAPDGSKARRLTNGGAFDSPSQADYGTVVAVTRTQEGPNEYRIGRIWRMSQVGRPLGQPVICGPTNSVSHLGPLRAEVNPGGTLVAFHWSRSTVDGTFYTAYCPVDRDAREYEFGSVGGHFNASWIDGERVAIFGYSTRPNVVVDEPSDPQNRTGQGQGWFEDSDAKLHQGTANRGLTRFAGIVAGGSEVRIYQMTGPPPAAPEYRCSFEGAEDRYENPTWSPDGRQLAWDEPDGIHVAEVPTLDDCSKIEAELVIPGGSDPHWGRANVPCVVPGLRGRFLPSAGRALTAAGCRLGIVVRRASPRRNRGRVIAQGLRAGTVRPLGTRVSVTVGR